MFRTIRTTVYSFSLIFIILLSSCVTTQISSNKSLSYNQKASKIFVIVNHSSESTWFVKGMMQQLMKQLTARGVECQVYLMDHLSLNPYNEINEYIRKMGPDVIVTVSETEKQMTIDPTRYFTTMPVLTGVIFDLKMTPNGNEEMIWRGALKAHGDFNNTNMCRSAATDVVNQFKIDGIIN